MAGRIANSLRDAVVTEYRTQVARKLEIVPYTHQGEWFCAADGLTLLPTVVESGGFEVKLPDDSIVQLATAPRAGGRAKVIADLGAFKVGKSFGAALWVSGFAMVPDARVQLIGLEYDICEPEFNYLCEFLLSARGMGIKADSLQNRPRDGRMWMDLPNGARFEAKSWERKDTLKGKEIDCYLYCEAYMLPGLDCYLSFSQNLRARDGYAVFPTTPDRPWVKEIHDRAHSGDVRFAKWHCTCGVPAEVNSATFDQAAKDRDKDLMTREKFAIHYEGQLGDFVGRVYGYQKGQRTFNHLSHPSLFRGGTDRANLIVPDGWEVVGGADTGTFTSAVLVMLSPEGEAFIIDEFPNYRYVSGVIELNEQTTIPEWCERVYRAGKAARMGSVSLWADKNSQFKRELHNQRDYALQLMSNLEPLEARTEITREYFQHDKVWLAPWLSVLPFELENARWPEEATAGGKFARVKDRDHTLDCLEHVLSKRPHGRGTDPTKDNRTWAEAYFNQTPRSQRARRDAHLGNQ